MNLAQLRIEDELASVIIPLDNYYGEKPLKVLPLIERKMGRYFT
jgi:hypothetical protein